jgi:hypothetical protein
LARERGAGGVHAGRSVDFAREESSPKVASHQAQMASGIARMDFDEAVGTVLLCFFLSFSEGKRFRGAVGVALTISAIRR